jgi:glutathione S-transferase
MITLYQFATSPFAEKVRRALAYKGLDYTLHEVDRAAVPSGAYAAVSPTGKFPAIEHDGLAVWDSTDILDHLETAFPDRPLSPESSRDRALAHVLEDWADESLYFYEMLVRLTWPHNLDAAMDEFAAGMPGVPRAQLKTAIMEGVRALTTAQGVGRKPAERVVADLERHFQALEQLLAGGGWLVGDRLSRADLAVAAQVNALLYAQEAREAIARTVHVTPWLKHLDDVAPSANPKA